jgi:hypothetical protein
MTTPIQQSVLGLSTEQTLLDDDIAIYSVFLDESEEKFNIIIQNKRHSFDETFYIHDKSIIKKYTGETGYTSEKQGTTLPAIVSQQVDVSSVTIKSSSVEQTISEENEKQIINEKLIVKQIPLMEYTPEPIAEETMETTCGVGTKLLNGICKIIIPDETKFCFLFWCW